MKKYIKVYKIIIDYISEATEVMNTSSGWFESMVIDVHREKKYYLVTVRSTFDYPFITNQWKKWIYEE